jgi:hypothetical protein
VAASTQAEPSDVFVQLSISPAQDRVTITLKANDTVGWFGVGFNASSMADTPYAIIFNSDGGVKEVRLANHAAGTTLEAMVKVR